MSTRPHDLDQIRERSELRFSSRRQLSVIPPNTTEIALRSVLTYVGELEREVRYANQREKTQRRGARVQYLLPPGFWTVVAPDTVAVSGTVERFGQVPAVGDLVSVGRHEFTVFQTQWLIDPSDPEQDLVEIQLRPVVGREGSPHA